MKLWIISQDVNNGYDTYSDAVVAAEDEDAARMIHPRETSGWIELLGDKFKPWNGKSESYDDWCAAEKVKVEYMGEAKPGTPSGVIVASFHAG
jgi:hypothetical protein